MNYIMSISKLLISSLNIFLLQLCNIKGDIFLLSCTDLSYWKWNQKTKTKSGMVKVTAINEIDLPLTINLLNWKRSVKFGCHHVDGLVQERRNSSVLAMKLHLSCTNPSMWTLTIEWCPEEAPFISFKCVPYLILSWWWLNILCIRIHCLLTLEIRKKSCTHHCACWRSCCRMW